MPADNHFIEIASLIGEPARATILWNLLDGRSYTASELAAVADISATSASNHLTKLLDADILKVEAQGRHRYFSFSRPEVAYVVESLANLSKTDSLSKIDNSETSGIKYCRTCYDHLAGYAGVTMTKAFETKKLVIKKADVYSVTPKGWEWLNNLDITRDDLLKTRRPVIRQCLDWSERRPHLSGQLGALLLKKMLEKNWFKRVQFSRQLIISSKGQQQLYELLGIQLKTDGIT
jgi:DNA-binding transcriptional ArsR family regulator